MTLAALRPVTPVEPQLTDPQRFRLVEIAHETTNTQIRDAALELLSRRHVIVLQNPLSQLNEIASLHQVY